MTCQAHDRHRSGCIDCETDVQLADDARKNERRAIVAWLRIQAQHAATFMDADNPAGNSELSMLADAIEREEHYGLRATKSLAPHRGE